MSEGASQASPSTEDLLFAAMDKQALRFIAMMNDEAKDEDGHPRYDIQLQIRLFQMGQDWLIRRKKLKPDGDGVSEGSGITDMRQWMSDPDVKKTIEQMVWDAGFVKVPPKKNGRPRVEDRPVRSRFQEYKEATAPTKEPAPVGSAWKGLLGEQS